MIVNRVRGCYVRAGPVTRETRRATPTGTSEFHRPSSPQRRFKLHQLLRRCCAPHFTSLRRLVMQRTTRASSHGVGTRAVSAARGKDASRDDALTQASCTGCGAGYVFCGSRFLPRTILNAVAATLSASSSSCSSSRDSSSRLPATAPPPRHGARRLRLFRCVEFS